MDGNRKRIGTIRSLLLWLGVLLAASSPALADDTELFSTRANPNVLLMLDTTGSMRTVDPGVTGVGDLDGDDTSNSRMDILWKVVYTLLNADLSIPSSSFTVTTALRNRYAAGPVSSIEVLSANWDSFPGSGTIHIGSGSTADTVVYSSKNVVRGRYYFQFSPSATFVYSHSRNDVVSYSGASSSYPYPYPTSNAEAISAAFAANITPADEQLLTARLGLMTFTTGSGGPQLLIRNQVGPTSPNAAPFTSPTRYSDLWTSVKAYANASGGTPTAQALNASQNFFTTAYDAGTPCRKNFAVLITDGEDTVGLPGYGNGASPMYYCSGSFYSDGCPSGWNPGQVTRNNQVIQAAATLKSRGVDLFAVGVGISGNDQHVRVLREVLRRAAEQQGVTGTIAEFNAIGAAGDNTSRAAGRAFFATDAAELAAALSNIFKQITLGTYSFTSPTVLSVRTTERNELYLASFSPRTPPATFWPGSLKAYTIQSDNSVTGRWDAATALQSEAPADRRIYTARYDDSLSRWFREEFATSNANITPAALGVPDPATRDSVIEYLRGASHEDLRKLGDIFHSKPILVGSPSAFHAEEGYSTAVPSSAQSFLQARTHRRRVVYSGANDGMLHAFLAGDWNPSTGTYSTNDTGEELFGYIPNTLLPLIESHVPGEATSHCYFVDSSPRVADVWIESNSDGVKQSSEWRTILIAGLRKGGEGYFALDVTDPPTSGDYANYPKVLWEYNDRSMLGETWSEPFIGKVRIQENVASAPVDRYVAVVGGGKSAAGTIGNSLLVFEVGTGAILKRFTGLDGEVAASPAAVLDGMGYIRFIYVPDLTGNLYKFDFRSTGTNYGSTPLAEWVGYKIFRPSPGGQPAYNRVEAVNATADGSVRYLYFGTGDRENPISNADAGKFYCIKDTDSFTGLIDESTAGNLADLTGSIILEGGGAMGTYGWKIRLSGVPSRPEDAYSHVGEKVLSDPVVFFDKVYFTTYTPNSVDPCSGGGIGRVYGLRILTAGAGMKPLPALGEIGPWVPSHVYTAQGMPSSPSLSINPGGQSSLFVGFSDGTYEEIMVDSPLRSKFIRSWKEQF